MNKAIQRLSVLLTLAIAMVAGVAHAGNGATLIPFVPSDAKAVVSIDFAALRASGSLDQLMANTGADTHLASITGRLNTVGFNPKNQIDTAFVVANSFERRARPLLIVEGANIPRARIEEAIVAEATATRSTVGQITVYTRSNRGSIAFLANDIAVIGPTPQVTAVARIAAGQARSTPASALASAISRADRGRSLWFAAVPPASMTNGTPVEGARALRGAANIGGALDLVVDATMASEAAATSTANSSRTQLSTVSQRDEVAALGLAPVIQAVTITSRGDNVRLALALDQARFRRLLTTITTVIRDQLQ